MTRLVDVLQLDPDDAANAFVRAAAAQAAAFLATHAWWPGLRSMEFAVAVTPYAASFRVQLAAAVGAQADQLLWIVAGAVPPAWFVPDRVREPADALRVYCQLGRAWLGTASRRRRGAGVFPFRVPRGGEARTRWVGQLECIERAVATPPDGQRPSGWLEAAQCVVRAPAPLGGAATPHPTGLAVGMLVLDPRGEPGILLHAAARPAASWLALQRDVRFRQLADGPWWKLAPLAGGTMLAPASLLTLLGETDAAAVATALAHANEFGKQAIREAVAARRAR